MSDEHVVTNRAQAIDSIRAGLWQVFNERIDEVLREDLSVFIANTLYVAAVNQTMQLGNHITYHLNHILADIVQNFGPPPPTEQGGQGYL